MVTTRGQSTATKTGLLDAETAKMSRKSTRSRQSLMKKKAARDENDSPAEEDSSDWEETSKRPRKRTKRILKSDVRKKTRWALNDLLLMPLDVQLEIFCWLSSKDLITVSRISKGFRRTLMSRSSTRIWKVARENNGVPAPPPNLSEPQWAVLLFDGARCECCGTPGVFSIDFGICRRVCVKCKKANLVFTLKFQKEYTLYDDILLNMIPYTNVGGWAHGYPSHGKFYWAADIHSIARQWAVLQDGIHRRTPGARKKAQDFLQARKELVETIVKGTGKYGEWHVASQHQQQMQRSNLRDNRRNEVIQRFKDLGYEAGDMDEVSWSTQANYDRELTERSWKRIRPLLESKIHQARQKRVVKGRKQAFDEYYDDYMKNLSPHEWVHHPSIVDILELPAIRSVLHSEWNIEITAADYRELTLQIPGSISAWQEERKSGMRELALAARHSISETTPSSASSVDPSDLATSVYHCNIANCRGLMWSNSVAYGNLWFGSKHALLHSCSQRNVQRFNEDNELISFCIPPKAYELAKELVELAGLDPQTATVDDMDKTDIKYFCKASSCYRRIIVAYGWRSAIAHVMSYGHSYSQSADWHRLSDEELQHLTPLDQDAAEQKSRWGSAHCNMNFEDYKPLATVKDHLKGAVHAIDDPIEGQDFIFYPERGTYEPPMWRYVPPQTTT